VSRPFVEANGAAIAGPRIEPDASGCVKDALTSTTTNQGGRFAAAQDAPR